MHSIVFFDKPVIMYEKGVAQIGYLVPVPDENRVLESIDTINNLIKDCDFEGRVAVRPSKEAAGRLRVHPGICLYFYVPPGEDPHKGIMSETAKKIMRSVRIALTQVH